MAIHVLMAAGLGAWGIYLLRWGKKAKGTYGWLALVVPCPVCMTVIFLSVAFLLSVFPKSGYAAVAGLYLGYMAIVLLTVIGMRIRTKRFGTPEDSTLGAGMLVLAAYFILTVVVAPPFGDVDKIYRLAAYEGEKASVITENSAIFAVLMAACFLTGFFSTQRKWKRRKLWK
jgi:predicted transporter